MSNRFWLDRWEKNDIGFHRPEANPLLVQHFASLALPANHRVFVPLCGKSLDLHWLLAHGYRVAGAELSRIAIEQLFAELGVEPRIAPSGSLEHFSAPNIDIFVGDIFALTPAQLGPVDAIYDRGALVALPTSVHPRYAAHVIEITRGAPQLLICYEYDQTLMDGPPFSVSDAELHRLYGEHYNLSLLASGKSTGATTSKVGAQEKAWHLKRR